MHSRKSRLLIPRFPLAAIRREQNTEDDEGSITVLEPTNTAFILPYCTLQPLSGYRQNLLPSGLQDKVVYRLFCSEEVRTVDEGSVDLADLVSDGKNVYYIQSAQPWQNNLINHYDCIIVKYDAMQDPDEFVVDSDLLEDLDSDYSLSDWYALWLKGSL